MRAWQFEGQGRPIALNEVPGPEPGPGEVVVDVRAAGLCHSDVMYMETGGRSMPYLPMTQGHETAGVIAALGDGVTGWKTGDRVGVCPSGVAPPPGMFRPGGFAGQHVAPAADLARVPDGLDISLGALATDAGMTAYHAMVKRGGAAAGMKVGVIGYGGLGQVGARAAVLKGAEVHVAEVKEDVWDLARSAGAVSVVADASAWAGQDFDLIVDYAGFDTTAKAVAAVKRGFGGAASGTVVQVGLGQPTITIPSSAILGKNLIGSLGGTVADIEEVYGLMLRKEIEPYYTEIAFEEIGEGLKRLAAAEVTGRLVARFGDGS
ncbi:MAG: zinc-binding dehydrogenase [Streptosporangiales bacterium]|nr:zinc-binding dehydrogenase [Streptosporangiales bacterium]